MKISCCYDNLFMYYWSFRFAIFRSEFVMWMKFFVWCMYVAYLAFVFNPLNMIGACCIFAVFMIAGKIHFPILWFVPYLLSLGKIWWYRPCVFNLWAKYFKGYVATVKKRAPDLILCRLIEINMQLGFSVHVWKKMMFYTRIDYF